MGSQLLKIMVAVKPVVDPYVSAQIRLKPDLSGVDISGLKIAMNPFDEIAVQAVKDLASDGYVAKSVAVSIGGEQAEEMLRVALAMGIDEAIHVETDEEDLQPLTIAKLLKVVIDDTDTNVMLMGKQAIDNDCNQVGQMLSALLGWSQGTFVSAIKPDMVRDELNIVREVDTGLENLSVRLPAVLTTDLRLNKPSYPTLPQIMSAKSKPMTKVSLAELAVEIKQNYKVIKYNPPPMRAKGEKLSSAAELFAKLKTEAKVI